MQALKNGEWRLEPLGCRVICGDASVSLSKIEFVIISLLSESSPNTVRREAILQRVYGQARTTQRDLALNVRVKGLRQKLPPAIARALITERGVGYRLDLRPRI